MDTAPKVTATVISYRKTEAQLLPLLSVVRGQVAEIVLVDNSGAGASADLAALEARVPALQVIANIHNVGVARAINQGVQMALRRGADLVLLLDDDSMPAANMVVRLLDAWRNAPDRGRAIAAVGPAYGDNSTGRSAIFPAIKRFGVQRQRCEQGTTVMCDYLMSSGMLIPRDVFEAVGPMNERFFIDYVDTEWCMRARELGLRFLAVCDAHMWHRFGDRAEAVRLWGAISIPYREPARIYYIYRNAVFMLRSRYCPLPWKVFELRRLVAIAALLITFGPERILRLKMIIRALNHGYRGISGQIQGNV